MFWSLDRKKPRPQQENAEPRRAQRFPQPEILVHYWDGSAKGGREIRDISEGGAYIYTSELWYPGTIIRIVMEGQRMTVQGDGARAPIASTCVMARVVRQAEDGLAVEFVFEEEAQREKFRTFLATIPVQPPEIPPAAASRRGQALVEFALIIPMIFLLAVNSLNFGGYIFGWITVAGAARDAAQYMILASASPGGMTPATLTQIQTLVASDVASLLNRSSAYVNICTNQTTLYDSSHCYYADPEATGSGYTLATTDVYYTYQPFIPLFSFPTLGISATLPSSTIHRKVVMRMLE